MWVYLKTTIETNSIYTVGYFMPGGEWIAITEFDDEGFAMARVNYLNGGIMADIVDE